MHSWFCCFVTLTALSRTRNQKCCKGPKKLQHVCSFCNPYSTFCDPKAKSAVRVPKNPNLSCPTPKKCCKDTKKQKKTQSFPNYVWVYKRPTWNQGFGFLGFLGPLQHFLRSRAKSAVRVQKNPNLSCPTPKKCCKGPKKPKKPNLFQSMFGSTCDPPGIKDWVFWVFWDPYSTFCVLEPKVL